MEHSCSIWTCFWGTSSRALCPCADSQSHIYMNSCLYQPIFNTFWWKPVLFNPQDALWAWFFYHPGLRDEEAVIQRPYLCCQGSHTHGMEKLVFNPKAENFKGCFLFTRLPCTKHCHCLLPTDTICRTEGKTWNHSREEKPSHHNSTCISFPCVLPIFLPLACSTCLPFI